MGIGNIRNLICSCGSGKKHKFCHKNGFDADKFEYRKDGGRIEIGEQDGDNVSDFLKIKGSLYVLSRFNIFKLLNADEIDPKKENPNLPNFNKTKILDIGTDSEIVGKTIQLAEELFRNSMASHSVDSDLILDLCLKFAENLRHTWSIIENFTQKIPNLTNHHNKYNLDGSLKIPSIGQEKIKLLVQNFTTSLDVSHEIIFELSKLFYPDLKIKEWEGQLINKTHLSNFKKLIEDIQNHVRTNREFTNYFRHASDPKFTAKFKDYLLRFDGKIEEPRIYFRYENYLIDDDLVHYLDICFKKTLLFFEQILLMFALDNLMSKNEFGAKIQAIRVEDRSESKKHVGYAYYISANFTPN